MMKLISFTSFGLLFALVACSSDDTSPNPGGGTAGTNTGTAGTNQQTAGTTGNPVGGSGSGTAGTSAAGGLGNVGGTSPTAGTTGAGGTDSGTAGTTGNAGTAGTGGGGTVPVELPPVVTSAQGAFWKTDVTPTDSTANATVTVNDTMVQQKWDGFGGSFNELGWKYLNSAELQAEAIKLLFSAKDGANLIWGRIPIGASDYAEKRYTPDDPAGTDPTPNGESNRPAADTTLSKFSLSRDKMYLIPYIKAAQAVKSDVRFWASPWTTPIWMKTGYKTSGDSGDAKRPSFFDGGTVTNTPANLTAYAEYFKKFVEGYKAEGINIEIVSPQNEPGYEQNYPSAIWENATYVAFINALGPVMKAMNVQVMLGTMSNNGDSVAGRQRYDLQLADAVLADATAKTFVTVAGAQWGVLKAVETAKIGNLPIWATEHKCGNYPWNPSGLPAYNSQQAPNDYAYGVESWGYIRDAINKAKVTAYSAWNMVLDKSGLGNDTSRDWKQNALLVVDGGKVNATPYYYVFRHFAQYVQPGANVVSASGGDAVAFKNPDGSLVAVMYNSGAANPNYVVQIGGKKLQFAMPGNGWATVKVKP